MHRFSILLIAAWLFFASVGQAAALPIAGAIVGAIGLTGAAATVATTIIGVGLTVGASVAVSALFSPEQPQASAQQASSGVKADVTFGGKHYHEYAFGLVASKGQFAYANTSGNNNTRLDQVYVLSTGWCEGLEKLFVLGEECTINAVGAGAGWTKYAVTLPDDGGTRRLWVSFYDGRPNQAVNQALVNSSNPSGRWTSEHIGAGACYVHVEANYVADIEAFRSILSGNAFLFVFKGLRLYDLRKDSTAGGTGAHRFDDPATWEWSENPAVAKYHFERGLYINGTLAGGMGVASYDLLTDLYIAAANVCDEDVPLDAGGTEKRYSLSLIAPDSAEHIDAIDSMVTAMAGMRVEREGLFGVLAGAAQVAVATITDGDLMESAPVSFSAKRPREDLVNEVHGQFTDPDNLWDGSDIVPVKGDSSVKALDGGETRPRQKDLYQVTSGTQGQRLLRIAYRMNRHQKSAQLTLGEEAIAYEVGDWIVWNSARHGSATYLIAGHSHDVDSDLVTLSLEEISSNVFAWGDGDESPLVTPPTPPTTGPRPSNVTGLTVQATTIEGADGQVLPAISVIWDAVEDETIRSVVLEHKIDGSADTTAIRTEHTRPATGAWTGTVLAAGILAGTDYEVRSSITTFPPRTVTWSAWAGIQTAGEYVVPSARALYDEVAGSIPADQLIADIGASVEIPRVVRDSLLSPAYSREAANDVLRQMGLAAESQLLNVLETERANAAIEGAYASISRVETKLIQDNLAFAEQITSITAKVDSNAAQIVTVDQARADGDSALATSLTSLSTTVGDNTASITTLATSVDGIEARYVLSVSAGGAVGGFTINGIQKADGTGNIDFGIAANRFFIVDPSDTSTALAPLVFQDGTLYLNDLVVVTITAESLSAVSANLGTVTAGKLQRSDGTMIVDLDNKRILIQ